jgi:hypothetical protein
LTDKAETEIWSVGKSPDPRVKSQFLYVQQGHEYRAVARFLSDEGAEKTKAMLLSVLPHHKDEDE